jgi:hypothetical protein
MILDPSEKASRRKTDSLDAELDALVAREVDAVSVRRTRPGVTRRIADGKAEADAPIAQRGSQSKKAGAVRRRRADAPASVAKLRPHDSNVIGIGRVARSGGADGILFSVEEEAFIKQSVAFLKGRGNADVVIEEIWTHSVLDCHNSLEDARSDEALSPEQVDELGPDALSGESPPRPDGSGPGANVHHEVTAVQADRGSKPKATGESNAEKTE